jgi:glycosyltransferase involved in cell wall biosynthesis
MSNILNDSEKHAMKILIVTHKVLRGDGQARVNYELVCHLVDWGHEVTLLTNQVSEDLIDRPRLTVKIIKVNPKVPGLLRDNLWAIACTDFLKTYSQQYEIIHLNGAVAFVPHQVNTSHFVHSSFRLFLRKEKITGLRSVYHRLHADVNARLEKMVYLQAEKVAAVSPKTKRELVEIVGIEGDRVEVICNAVDTKEFYPDADRRAKTREKLGIPVGQFAALYVGDFRLQRKGLRTVLEALVGLPEDIHLYVAGKGEPENYADQLTPVQSRVHFLGYRRDIADLLQAADVFAFPTRYEAMALVVLEALASGLPIITTIESGMGELMQSGVNGFVMDPYDAKTLNSQLLTLYSEPEFSARMRLEARQLALQFTWEGVAKQYLTLYKRVAKKVASSANLLPSSNLPI